VIIVAMKRQPAIPAEKKPRKGKGPKTYAPNELRSCAEFLRVLLKEVDAWAQGMDDNGLDTITLQVRHGAESYALAEQAINAWIKGVRTAVLEGVRTEKHSATRSKNA